MTVISSVWLSLTRSARTAAACGILKTGQKLDKDVFRRDLGSLTDAYTEVARRLGVMPNNPPRSRESRLWSTDLDPSQAYPGLWSRENGRQGILTICPTNKARWRAL